MSKTPKKDPNSKSVAKKTNVDGFANLITGLGVPGADKSETTFFKREWKLPQEQLDALYASDGLTKTIVQIVPEQMMSKGFVIEGDPDGFVKAKLESLGAMDKIIEMLYWARLYGGGIIVMGLDDLGGNDLEYPVDITTLRDVKYLHVFDRYQVNQGLTPVIDMDMNSPNYGLPLIYNLNFYQVNGQTQTIRVHHSRILRVDGITLPARLKAANQWWGESEIQACFREIKAYSATFANIASLIHSFVIPVFGVKGLSDSMNCGTEDLVAGRIAMANISMSNLNMLVKDTEETFEKVSTPLAGISEILDRFMMTVSSVTRIPVSLLFGRSAAGLNSTGEHDTNAFYDYIIQQQEKKLKPVLEKLVRLIMLSKDGDFNGVEPENWSIVFNPLVENSPTEEANYRHRIAETDEKYINMGVLEPQEVRESRFGSGVYSNITTLSDESLLQEEFAETGSLENQNAMIELFRKVDALKADAADGKKKAKFQRGKKMLFPMNAEKAYLRILRELLSNVKGLVRDNLLPPLRFILEESQENYAPDTWRLILNQTIERITEEASVYVIDSARKIAQVGLQISAYNARQFSSSVSQDVGVDLFLQNPWLKTQLESFAEQSSALILTLTEDEISDVKGIVLRAVSNGDRFTQTAENMQKRFEISSRHAKMIARDQTAKLNSSLSRLRQEDAGIDLYIWQTSGDDRVRKSHKVLDGMECSWKDDSIYRKPGETTWRKRSSIGATEYNVGQDFSCRCTNIPWFP